jgi:hypothetical protein
LFDKRAVHRKPYRLYDGLVALKRGSQRCPTRRHRFRPPIRAGFAPRGQAIFAIGAGEAIGPERVRSRAWAEMAPATPRPIATSASANAASAFIQSHYASGGSIAAIVRRRPREARPPEWRPRRVRFLFRFDESVVAVFELTGDRQYLAHAADVTGSCL